MSWGERARRGRVRVRGGRNYAGMSLGRGNSVFMDNNPFSALDSEDNDDSDTPGGFVIYQFLIIAYLFTLWIGEKRDRIRNDSVSVEVRLVMNYMIYMTMTKKKKKMMILMIMVIS